MSVEVVSADHQGKPDIGAQIAARWFDLDGVDAIADMQGSPIGFAVQNLARQRGRIMLLSGSMTRWRLSLLKLIPLRVHFMTDLVLGAFLILSPFIFGFSSNGAATRFTIIYGALELVTALSTRWEPLDIAERGRRGRSGVAAAR